MLHQPQSTLLHLLDRRVVAQPGVRRVADVATGDGSDQTRLEPSRSHPLRLALEDDESEEEVLPQDPRDFRLDLMFPVDLTKMGVLLQGLLGHQVDVPDREVRIVVLIQQGPADVLAKDAAVVGRRLRDVEPHLRLAEEEVIRDSALEIALSVRPDPHNPGAVSPVTPGLALLIKEVDTVLGQLLEIERIRDHWQRLKLLLEPATEFRHPAPATRCPRGE